MSLYIAITSQLNDPDRWRLKGKQDKLKQNKIKLTALCFVIFDECKLHYNIFLHRDKW